MTATSPATEAPPEAKKPRKTESSPEPIPFASPGSRCARVRFRVGGIQFPHGLSEAAAVFALEGNPKAHPAERYTIAAREIEMTPLGVVVRSTDNTGRIPPEIFVPWTAVDVCLPIVARETPAAKG